MRSLWRSHYFTGFAVSIFVKSHFLFKFFLLIFFFICYFIHFFYCLEICLNSINILNFIFLYFFFLFVIFFAFFSLFLFFFVIYIATTLIFFDVWFFLIYIRFFWIIVRCRRFKISSLQNSWLSENSSKVEKQRNYSHYHRYVFYEFPLNNLVIKLALIRIEVVRKSCRHKDSKRNTWYIS